MIDVRAASILVAVGGCLMGCSTTQIAQFETKVGAKRCAMDGVTADSPQFEQCVADYKAGWEQEKAANRAGVATAIGVGIAARKTASGAVGSPTTVTEIILGQLPSRNYVARKLDNDLYQLDRSHVVQTRYCHAFANYSPATVVGSSLAIQSNPAPCTIIRAWRL